MAVSKIIEVTYLEHFTTADKKQLRCLSKIRR